MIRTRLVFVSSLAAAAIWAGACLPSPDHQPPVATQPPYPDAPTVIVSGYVWDPEAVQYGFGMCGMACPLRPILMPGMPMFERTLVPQAQVSLLAMVGGKQLYSATTGDAGFWFVEGVARTGNSANPTTWLAPQTVKAVAGPPPVDAGSPGDAGGPPPGDGGIPPGPPFVLPLAPIPPAQTYFPTMMLMVPIVPRQAQCISRPSAVIGNSGILDSVAKYLTLHGTPTTPEDFVNPGRYGGVVIWWAFEPQGSSTRQGAGGTTIQASAGQTIYVNWGCTPLPGSHCPPPFLSPPMPQIPDALATLSARNFYVMPDATSSNIGLSVTLFPPLMGPPSPVIFKISDPVVDAAQGRPYGFTYIPVPPVFPTPGHIEFGELVADEGQPGPAPDFLSMCLP